VNFLSQAIPRLAADFQTIWLDWVTSKASAKHPIKSAGRSLLVKVRGAVSAYLFTAGNQIGKWQWHGRV
jgi:hypothetical protein